MEESENIAEFFKRVKSITNQMATEGETLNDGKVSEKIMLSLHEIMITLCVPLKNYNVSFMSLEELQNTLEARELRLSERINKKWGDYNETKKNGGNERSNSKIKKT